MRIGLVVNSRIETAVGESLNIIEFLKDKVELFITNELEQLVGGTYKEKPYSVAPLTDFAKHQIELLITIGGDGTILRALHNCNIKIFGINAGVVGFLTEINLKEAMESLIKILNNEYILDERVRIMTMLNNKTLEPATNEAVIHTSDIAKMRLYQIKLDGVIVQNIHADGIIISTPTGSTSYAMSAGGPIIDPKVDAFLIVPIAPYKLSARPLVVPSSSIITIKIMESHRNSVLVIDGQEEYEVTSNDELSFAKDETPARFIRFEPNFYKSIEEKLTTQ